MVRGIVKHFVERTCTVVRGRDEERRRETESSLPPQVESRPLESFRDAAAYVLLGPPGSGKTEAFEREAKYEGVEAITARDFQALGPDPEWRSTTLYIDGLDEARAGATDGRTPFDAIRARLQEPGHPRFRLSCREADWFGANDRERLKAVAPSGELLVLQLDPLSDQGILDILDRNLEREDPQGFVDAARKRGVDGLLRNPLNLEMLSAAVAEADGEWPRTRVETFEMACRKLVSEKNPEHQIAWRGTADTTALLDAAGDLCAVLLMAGKAGVTLPGTEPDTDHPRLEDVPQGGQQLLRRVVDTNLFALSAEGRLVPAHRQLAEFLAARRLADLVADGVPAGRVLSLMTGFDGGVISEFRGLAAWLAAHSKMARSEIIDRDPLGVVLYGDVQDFSAPEKRLILQTLEAETDRNPWLVGDTNLDSPLGYLVGSDLEDDFCQILCDPARDEAHQSFVFLIVEAIRTAAPLPGIADSLIGIVRDNSWSMTIRCAALEAYTCSRQGDTRVSVTLRRLLEEVYTGVVATRNDDLLGTLLMELYPDDLPVPDLVGYLREPARRNLWTRYGVFWTDRLIEKSTIEQMVQLLDLLRVPMEQVRADSGESPSGVDLVVRPPIVLLRHLLKRSPDSVSRKQLSYWLDFAGWLGQELEFSFGGVVGDAQFFRDWLSERTEIQKAIIEDGVSTCRKRDHFFPCMYNAKRNLFGATPPGDYGAWCADQALGASADDIAHWFVWEAAAFVRNAKGLEPHHRAEVAGKLCGDARLTRLFEGRLAALKEQSRFEEGLHSNARAQPLPSDGRFDKLRGWAQANEAALHANQCPPNLLHHLARAYLNDFSDIQGDSPEDRLRFLLGPGDDLLGAALAGLRGATCRGDLPTDTEILRLTVEGQLHPLAYPFMVGLEELCKRTETSYFHLDEAQKRLALAIHFAVWRLPHSAQLAHPPRWLLALLAQDPDTVSKVWARCAGAKLRKGEQLLPDVYELAHNPDFAPLAKAAVIRLLQAIPVSCKARQLPILRSLLQAACVHGDRSRFLELIEAKLGYSSMKPGQRVYWLTAGLFVNPGAYSDRLESYVSGRARRVQRLAEMAVERHAVPQPLRDMWDATVLETLIRLIGPYSVAHPDTDEAFYVTLEMEATWSLADFIDRLSEDTSDAARNALESLAADDRLVSWRSRLLDRVHRQKSVCREANFAHPGLEQVAEVLDNGRPANAADLWALTVDLLRQFSERIRDGATSDWRQYWNVDQYNRAEKPKPENACRDALLSDLQQALTPLGVEAVKEGSYADDKRSDIRVSVPWFNVPIEIKRSCHPDWWSAIKTQLIANYTRDPGADGYGIYLVFWFGEAKGCRPVPASGRRPKSPEELGRALIDSLSDLTKSERRKISVCVIDVSKPDAQGTQGID